jgi:acetoin utilization deacetylase AcuC-like enzyme
MEIADRSAGGRVVSVLEGGYNLAGLASAAAAHVGALAGLSQASE